MLMFWMGDDKMSLNYAIIRVNFNPKESIYEQRTKACIDFNKKYMKNTPIPFENFLVLWNNVTLSAEMGHSTTNLLTVYAKERMFPEVEGLFLKDVACPIHLYMENPKVLTNGVADASLFLKRLTILYNYAGIIPTFLQDDILYKATMEDLNIGQKESLKEYESEPATRFTHLLKEAEEEVYLNETTKAFYEKMFSTLSNLFNLFEDEITSSYNENFISQYFNWQIGESITKCLKNLNSIANTTFYRYADAFEKSPFYSEYFYAYYLKLADTPKRGELYTSSIILYELKYKEWCESGKNPETLSTLLTHPFPSLDVHRIHLSCLNKLNTLFQKTKLNEKLTEENVSEQERSYIIEEVTQFRRSLRKKKTVQ